jgi:sucrose-6-phosphate hydrolase SacC (GH32 family)
MESASDLVPVFQYRNWPRPIANDQTQPDDDDNSIQIEHLAQSFDAATSIRQGWNDTSSLAGLHQSARSDDLHISQWKARIGTFQQHTHMAMETSIDPELVPSSLEQVNNEISTFLCDRYNSDEPWNALAAPRKSYVDTSAPATYNISLHIAPNPGTLSMYYTATSEVVTNEVFHSATSRMGGYRNAVLGTISV